MGGRGRLVIGSGEVNKDPAQLNGSSSSWRAVFLLLAFHRPDALEWRTSDSVADRPFGSSNSCELTRPTDSTTNKWILQYLFFDDKVFYLSPELKEAMREKTKDMERDETGISPYKEV